MAVRLRLSRGGRKKQPFYRIVAAEGESRRDGRFLEILGTYNPMVEPAAITLKEERIKYWIANGALCTQVVGDIVKKSIPNLIEEKTKAQRDKIQAKRKARKARMKKAA